MNQTKKGEASFLNGVCELNIVEREWGIERVYKWPDAQEHCIQESLLFSSDVD